MRLTHVLVASDLNPRYLRCWEPAANAWETIAGLEPVLVLIAHESETPAELRADPRVQIFAPLPDLHTALQAQCVRLLYPALVDSGGGAVLTSDIDMVPLNRRYFHSAASRIDERHFLAYRDSLMSGKEVPICYNAAVPVVWGDIFGVATLGDVTKRLREWGSDVLYEGVRGRAGWDTDQQVLYRALVERALSHRDVWILDDRYSGYRRLLYDYIDVDGLDRRVIRGIAKARYSDFHFLHPYDRHRTLNESIVRLATKDS